MLLKYRQPKLFYFLLLIFLTNSAVILAESGNVNLRGWNYLAGLMIDLGADRKTTYKILADPRLPKKEIVYFKVKPQEAKAIYKNHNTLKARTNAIKFYKVQRQHFLVAQKQYNVPASVILAILQVETQCGKYTGEHSVFYRLARLAVLADPHNVNANIKKYKKIDPKVTTQAIQQRAKWLEQTFLPHLLATIKLAEHNKIDPLEIKGSIAGAIGLPQFLPGNVFKYGVDANRDGLVDLYTPADAILSVARFLSEHGWTKLTVNRKDRSKVLLEYNRSQPYVDTVLNMAVQLEKQLM